jgi:hypothetical protein
MANFGTHFYCDHSFDSHQPAGMHDKLVEGRSEGVACFDDSEHGVGDNVSC